jgi:hypothetical protein
MNNYLLLEKVEICAQNDNQLKCVFLKYLELIAEYLNA